MSSKAEILNFCRILDSDAGLESKKFLSKMFNKRFHINPPINIFKASEFKSIGVIINERDLLPNSKTNEKIQIIIKPDVPNGKTKDRDLSLIIIDDKYLFKETEHGHFDKIDKDLFLEELKIAGNSIIEQLKIIISLLKDRPQVLHEKVA